MREEGDSSFDEVRKLASSLPRSSEVLVRDRVKFRVGRIVYLALSRDETLLGFAFPKAERDALVAAERANSCCRSNRTCVTTGWWSA